MPVKKPQVLSKIQVTHLHQNTKRNTSFVIIWLASQKGHLRREMCFSSELHIIHIFDT